MFVIIEKRSKTIKNLKVLIEIYLITELEQNK